MANAIVGATFKLERVAIHIQEIQACVDAYSARYPHAISPQSNGKTKFNVTAPEAVDIAVIAGEAIYQLRSTLDNLAFYLVKLNQTGEVLPNTWEDDCQFPVWLTIKSGEKPPLPYNVFKKRMPCISKPAFAFIESIQPYYHMGAVNNSLRLLNVLSNIDKHRHFSLTKHRGQLYGSGRNWSSSMAVDDGAELELSSQIPEYERSVNVYWMLSHFVSFAEPEIGDACCPSVQEIIQTILDQVQGVIVPAFEKFINQG